MQSNGICSITVKGVVHPLYFGRQAIEELTIRTEANFSASPFKILVDMTYAGMCAHAGRNDMPYPRYNDVYVLCENFEEEEDSAEQYEAVDKCFKTSKYGSDYIEKMEGLKKKLEMMAKEATPTRKRTGKTLKATA